MVKLIFSNKELQNIIVEQNKQISELIPKIGNTTNNTFNLNVFLNEECKDAINWTEFINSIELELIKHNIPCIRANPLNLSHHLLEYYINL